MPFRVKVRFIYLALVFTENQSFDGPLWKLEKDLPHLDVLLQFGVFVCLGFFLNQVI